MAKVKFGMFDWIDQATTSIQTLYANRLALAQAADKAGFFAYHLAEHHGTPLGMAPSPALFLTAVASCTQRIRLGPLAYLLPLYNPLRLIEEVCMLDQLSGGRLELGISRGVSPYEIGCFDIDANDTRDIFTETVEIFRAGMLSDSLNHAGKYYRYREVPMTIKPLQRPYPPLWYPTHNPTSVEYAARHGYHFVSLGPITLLRELTDHYRAVWNSHRHDPDRINGHVAEPILGTMRQIFIADTDDEAMAIARAAYRDWNRSITWLWHRHQDHAVDGLFDWDTGILGETILIGSPRTVREKIERLIAESGCNYVIGAFAWGTLTQAQSLRSLELFATQVMPGF